MKSPLPPNPWWIRQKPPGASAWLWPTVGMLSIGVHGLLLSWVRVVVFNPGQAEDRSGGPVPIQLVDLPEIAHDGPTASAESQPSLSPVPSESAAESAPTVAAPNSAPPADAPETAPSTEVSSVPEDAVSSPAVEPAPTVQPPPMPAPAVEPAPIVQPLPMPAPAVEPAPTVQPLPMPAPAVEPAPTVQPPPMPATAPPASSAPAADPTPSTARPSGQVVPLAIRQDPNGRDLPDTLPQLESSSAIWLEPFLSGCGVDNLAALAGGRTGATVQMRLTVETNGQISAVTVLQGSGDPAFDQLAACVVQRGLRLQPASSDGVNQPTDAVILEAQIQL